MEVVKFIVEKTKTGYSAYVENLDGGVVATTGDDLEHLKLNAIEAYNGLMGYLNQKPITADQIQFCENN